MSAIEVKNTLCFDFGLGHARPTLSEIADFIKTLDADADEIEACYKISEEKAIYTKFKSEESMLHALQHNSDELIFHYADGKAVKVHMSPAGGKVLYVRVYDLPPEVPDNALASVLGKYGKVKRIVREKLPAELGLNMQTGVRGVYMEVKKEIPSSLHFLNRKGNIFYEGNKNLCFLSKLEGHRMNSCPKRKARMQQEPKNPKEGQKLDLEQQQQHDEELSGSSTYAGVVSGSASLDNNDKEPEVEVLEKEVVDMEVTSPEVEKRSEKEATEQQPPVFKHPNDAYYFYRFGIVDYTEKERIKDEEEAKRKAMEQEELRELRRRQKEEAKPQSPPRKHKKNS